MRRCWLSWLAAAGLVVAASARPAAAQQYPGWEPPAGRPAASLPPSAGSFAALPPASGPAYSGPVSYGGPGQPPPRADYAPMPADPHAQPGCAGSHGPEFLVPNMLGDLIGPLGTLFTELKASEGNSPRPVDRVYFNFNYFDNAFKTQWADPAQSVRHVDVYRYVFGFEKTFLDQRVSLTVQVPFFTMDVETRDRVFSPDAGGFVANTDSSFTSTDLGNISANVKAVLWEDKASGDLLSAGMIVTLPTASSRLIDPGPGSLAYVEPYLGFIWCYDNFYAQGFLAMTVPVARPESIVAFTDLGVGYYVYKNPSGSGCLRAVAPTFEVHVTDPLRQTNPNVDIFGIADRLHIANTVDLTYGVTFEFSNRSTLAVGVCNPVTGPKPFDVEGIVQFNYRF